MSINKVYKSNQFCFVNSPVWGGGGWLFVVLVIASALLTYNSPIMQVTHLKCMYGFFIILRVIQSSTLSILSHFHCSKKKSFTHSSLTSSINLLSVSLGLSILDISQKCCFQSSPVVLTSTLFFSRPNNISLCIHTTVYPFISL